MKYSYRLHTQAETDILDAYAWYEDKQVGLGEKFFDAVQNIIQSIVREPEWFGSKHPGYRETIISKEFPYLIVYKIYKRKNEIIISSIFHQKRNPKNKYRK